MNKYHWLMVFVFLAGSYACTKGMSEPQFEGFKSPAYFPAPKYHFETNSITDNGFKLGRSLFYETMLSSDNSISCGSCHIQTSAFTHHGHIVSHGVADRMGTRNSPPIMNLAWYPSFMWDGGVFDLDLQAIAPITNHVEMDESMASVLGKLRASAKYQDLFTKAYGSPEITTANFLKSLSQFMLMCVSSNSKYDSIMRHEPGKSFSAEEQSGYSLFKQKCGTCHAEPLFTDNSFRNNGLAVSSVNDAGRYLITQNETDRYRFKVPSLRNLEYTAPYMHDGRFLNLDAVFDHYSTNMENTPNLDPTFLANANIGIPLTANEKQAIRAFLNTLNDRSFILDQRFAEQ